MYLALRKSRIQLSISQVFSRELGEEGPVVIFLHGSWNDSQEWLSVMHSLAPHYRCFAPDLIGFGDSRSLIKNPHYSIDLQVESVAEYLKKLNLNQVYFVAHSLGAWIGTSYALKYPHQVRGLILISPEGVTPPNITNRWQISQLLVSQPPLFFWFCKLFYPLAGIFGKKAQIQECFNLRKKLLKFPTSSSLFFQRKSAEIKAELLDTKLNFLKTPTVILQGQKESSLSISLGETYVSLNPSIKLKSLPESEDLLRDSPHLIAESISTFVPKTLYRI